MAHDFYDPYTMRVKEIPELVEELNKLIMPKLPGGKERQAVWGALCQAAEMYSMAHRAIVRHAEGIDPPDSYVWTKHGEHYAAAMIIRKIADGFKVSNFKMREVPLEPQAVPGDQPQRQPDPGEEDQPG